MKAIFHNVFKPITSCYQQIKSTPCNNPLSSWSLHLARESFSCWSWPGWPSKNTGDRHQRMAGTSGLLCHWENSNLVSTELRIVFSFHGSNDRYWVVVNPEKIEEWRILIRLLNQNTVQMRGQNYAVSSSCLINNFEFSAYCHIWNFSLTTIHWDF